MDIQIEKKYSSSNLSEIKESFLYNKLLELLKKQAPYLNQECSLTSLAFTLQTNTKYLSQVINNQMGLGARTLINTYRVNHFKKLVEEGHHKTLSINGLAMMCGFSNKVSFHHSVKKITGLTPGDYIKTHGGE